ncbi:MAG: DUF3592 domain-containing protein [Geobacter sp.]|nr:DUF3592 domain-containing protein [Geobacter sp.]
MTWFFILFAIFGLIGVIAGAGLFMTGLRSRRWPFSLGKVILSQAVFKTRKSGDTSCYVPEVNYTFTVEGREYTGDTISVRGVGSRLKDVQQIIAKYPVESQVIVFYNPKDPTDSLLEPGADASSALPFIVGVVFLSFALFQLFK